MGLPWQAQCFVSVALIATVFAGIRRPIIRCFTQQLTCLPLLQGESWS